MRFRFRVPPAAAAATTAVIAVCVRGACVGAGGERVRLMVVWVGAVAYRHSAQDFVIMTATFVHVRVIVYETRDQRTHIHAQTRRRRVGV